MQYPSIHSICELLRIASELSGNYDQLYLKSRSSRGSDEFGDSFNFLLELGIISLHLDSVVVDSDQINKLKDVSVTSIVDLILTCAAKNENTYFFDEIVSFIGSGVYYDESGDAILKVTPETNTKHASLRNLLIESGLISRDYNDLMSFVLDFRLLSFLDRTRISSNITPKKLAAELLNRDKIGQMAELEILKREQHKLSKWPEIASKIVHTAAEDVSAGYDIVSYEPFSSENDPGFQQMFIEVKAVSSTDYKFFLTRNEIRVASEKNKSYFIYLVPVGHGGSFQIDKLLVIRDPFDSIILSNDRSWLKEDEVVSFRKSFNE